MLQVAEHAARCQPLERLGVDRALARVDAVVDGEARHDRVEQAQVGQRLVYIVLDDRDQRVAGEALARGRQQRRREVERDGLGLRAVDLQQRQQPPVAGAQVEDPLHITRHQLQQARLALGAVRHLVGARQVGQRVLGIGPVVHNQWFSARHMAPQLVCRRLKI